MKCLCQAGVVDTNVEKSNSKELSLISHPKVVGKKSFGTFIGGISELLAG